MYYRSGTGGRCCICAGQTLHVQLPHGSTFWREMTSRPPSWSHDVKSNIQHCQSMRIYSKEQSCQMPSRSDLKRWSLRLLLKRLAQEEQQEKNKCETSSWSKNKITFTATGNQRILNKLKITTQMAQINWRRCRRFKDACLPFSKLRGVWNDWFQDRLGLATHGLRALEIYTQTQQLKKTTSWL